MKLKTLSSEFDLGMLWLVLQKSLPVELSLLLDRNSTSRGRTAPKSQNDVHGCALATYLSQLTIIDVV
jgi:hypothetical protein